MKKLITKVRSVFSHSGGIVRNSRRVVSSRRAEGYVDTGLKILISVVLGALLLAGLYALFGDTILPTLTEKVEELFSYSGT